MSDANLRDKAPTDAVARSPASRIPTTGPHPIPGGEYDRDGFLYRCHVENTRHERIRTELSSVLRAYMRRHHGPRALVAAEVGLYARREDRFAKPLAPDILVSLTAGDLATPGTPPEADRMSYKLWQEPVPDFVLEIISPRSGVRDTREKPNRYEAMGIQEYWVFDPHRRWLPKGLHGRLLVDGRYRDAEPQVPDAARARDGKPPRTPRAPLPAAATVYWSDALRLYLYADGLDVALHDPLDGRLRTVGGEWAARASAEERTAAAEGRAAAAEERAASAEGRAASAESRAAALEAELERLRKR